MVLFLFFQFLNEEALACELAAYFYFERKERQKSVGYFKLAHEKYMEWVSFSLTEIILYVPNSSQRYLIFELNHVVYCLIYRREHSGNVTAFLTLLHNYYHELSLHEASGCNAIAMVPYHTNFISAMSYILPMVNIHKRNAQYL